MGTVVLADVTELNTMKISELPEASEAVDNDIVPILKKDILATKGIKNSNLTHKQNTDTKLNEGGANEIAVTEIPRKATADIAYYIDPNGSDSDPGTSAEPFATIQHAIDLLPKILDGHIVNIYLKDGTYAEGDIKIEHFIEGEINIFSANWDADLALINVPVDKYKGFDLSYNAAYVYIAYASIKIQKDNGACIAATDSLIVEFDNIKVGDNNNTGTMGLYFAGGKAILQSVSDIDANKVSTGLTSTFGSIVALADENTFGDVFTNVASGGIITDGIRLIKADYDDAITKKHTQNTDTALGAQSENLDMNTHRMVNVVNPVDSQDATTKLFVSNMDVNGGGF